MKILVEDEIRDAIVRCKPSKIAVAYIGADWKRFIDNATYLEAIIISPTFGSNPRAITDLVKKIGWEKIFFLDELHAKTYIGGKSAVIGSANLTRNGLDAESLIELCVEVNAEESLKKLNRAFDDMKRLALAQYPTTESKKSRLQELEKNWGAAIVNRIIRGDNRNRQSFVDFEPLGEGHFYVLWYQPVDCEYSEDVKAIQSLMTDEIHFSVDDEPEKNKWALVWCITASFMPYRTAKPHWLYIHEIFEDGVIDEGYKYPKCAIQRKDMEVPPPPFELTDDVVTAFKRALQEEDVAKYLIQDGEEIFSLADSSKGVSLLIGKMQEYMANKANAAADKRRHG